ncbi:hypothetical protein SK069_10770 [Patulibacter brassicae]|uniref:SMI1/KNR4 family protein n=1 Tax=Patulibacter brassicae TaxID=1705717 RepID=A0ABU4VJU6_9ACTN|nr:hypothetical protein [Patulibacter brassicae]MDX8152078.1 hypothetical protein [Patulibacter brassicae]
MTDDQEPFEDVTWPPTERQLGWRPTLGPPEAVEAYPFVRRDRPWPSWIPRVDPDDLEDLEVPAYALAWVDWSADFVGGSGAQHLWAFPLPEGGFAVAITDFDDLGLEPHIARFDEIPTLGEVIDLLDNAGADGEWWGIGHGHRVRNDLGDGRSSLRGMASVGSELYPMLGPLDRAREAAWIAEQP